MTGPPLSPLQLVPVGLACLAEAVLREDALAKRQEWQQGSPQHTPLPQPAASARLPKGACKPLGCSDGVKDNPGAGIEANGMERTPVILDYFSRALRKQPAGPHTDTSSHRPVKTSVGETTSCSKIPSLPMWATTAFSSPGGTPCRSCISHWCHRAALHISNKTLQCVWGVSADHCPHHSQMYFINLFALLCVWSLVLVHIQSLPCSERWGLESADLHPGV